MWIDSHAHLSSETIWEQIDEIIAAAKENGVDRIVNICTDALSLERGLELNGMYPMVINTAATTPHDVVKEGEEFFPLVQGCVDQLVAIGETGLDYYYEHSPKDVQQKFLRKYFALAKEAKLPVVIHCREAYDDLFAIADETFEGGSAVLHCFTGTLEEAKKVIERGWYLSISGIVTFKKSQWLRDVAKYVPLNQLLIETDTPYLSPQSKRGKMNQPAYLPETGALIADVKEVDLEEFAHITAANATAFFSL